MHGISYVLKEKKIIPKTLQVFQHLFNIISFRHFFFFLAFTMRNNLEGLIDESLYSTNFIILWIILTY